MMVDPDKANGIAITIDGKDLQRIAMRGLCAGMIARGMGEADMTALAIEEIRAACKAKDNDSYFAEDYLPLPTIQSD